MRAFTLILSILGAIGCVLTSNATTVHTSLSGDMTPGNEVLLEISLSSDVDIYGLQVEISDFTTFGTLIDGSWAVTGRATGYDISSGVRADGSAAIFLYTMNMSPISMGDGVIASLSLKLGENPFDRDVAIKATATDAIGEKIECHANPLHVFIGTAFAEYPNGSVYNFNRIPLHSIHYMDIPVYNGGTSPLIISSVDFSIEALSVADDLPLYVPVGDTGILKLQLGPSKRGSFSATATIHSNSTGANVLRILGTSYAVNEFYTGSASGNCEDIVEIPLTMKNMDDICGFTIEFDLPEEVQYIDGSFQLSDRAKDHQLSVSISGQRLLATAYSLTNSPFDYNDGDIASFKARLFGSHSPILSPSKVVLSSIVNGNIENVVSDIYPGSVTIDFPAIYVSKQILFGRTPISETASAGFSIRNTGTSTLRIDRIVAQGVNIDINGTFPKDILPKYNSYSTVELNDTYEGIIDGSLLVYTNDPVNPVTTIRVSGQRYAPNFITADASSTVSDLEEGYLCLKLSNYDTVQALQFDLEFPVDTQTGTTIFSSRATNFMADIYPMDRSTVRIFIYSLAGDKITPGNGDLAWIQFTVPGDSDIVGDELKIKNVKLSDTDMRNRYSGPESVAVAWNRTDVTNVQTTEVKHNLPAEYYNLQGIRVSNPQKGRLYIRRKNTSVEKLIFDGHEK